MGSSDWSNGIRYHTFDARSDTEFKSREMVGKCVEGRSDSICSGPCVAVDGGLLQPAGHLQLAGLGARAVVR